MQQITAQQIRGGRNMKMTVIRRQGRRWQLEEIGQFVNAFLTGASWDQKSPYSLVIYGHFSEEQIRSVLPD